MSRMSYKLQSPDAKRFVLVARPTDDECLEGGTNASDFLKITSDINAFSRLIVLSMI